MASEFWLTKSLRVLRLSAVALLVGAVGSGVVAQEAKVRIGFFPTVAHVAPIYVADGMGYFAEEGVQVEPVEFARANEAIPALITGEIDAIIGVSVGGALYNAAAARPGSVKLVAGVITVIPEDLIGGYVRSDLADQIKSPADLAGRTVFLPQRGGAPEYALHVALRDSGLSIADVNLQTLPSYQELEQAFRSKAIEVGILGEPFAQNVRDDNVAVPLFPYGKHIAGSQLTYVAYGSRLLVDDRDLGERTLRALLRGVQDYEVARNGGDNRAQVVGYLANGLGGTDPDVIDRSPWYFLTPDGSIDVDSLLDTSAYFASQGFIDVNLPPEEILDLNFARSLAGEE